MTKSRLAATVLLVLAWTATDPSRAGNVGAIHWESELGISAADFRYREFGDTGRLLDREDGFLPGLKIGLSGRSGAWEFSAGGTYHAGRVGYEGRTNLGSPLRTNTDEKITDLSLIGGRWFSPIPVHPIRAYFGVGYRRWQRDILPAGSVLGLSETYRWGYALVGANALMWQKGSLAWSADLRLTQPFCPTVNVDFGGVFDATRLDLGARAGFRTGFPLRYSFGDKNAISLEPYYEQWNLGRSSTVPLTRNQVPVGFVFEPKSDTRIFGINLSWLHLI
jgi:hypothetical protein